MKKIVTFLIAFAFLAQSAAPTYALRPASTAHSEKLPDENKKIIIDTKELGLKAKQKIAVSDMLERFSKKHSDLLEDPLSVLVVMRQEDARLTFKTDFNNSREHPVKKGETYLVAYQHSRLVINKKLPVPRGIWVHLGGLTPREKPMFEKLLKAIGKLKQRRAYTWARILTEKWVEKEEAEGISKLEFAKKLLVYYYRGFKYKPSRYEEDIDGLYYVLETLLQAKDVETFMSQLIKSYYAQGEDAMIKGSRADSEKIYVDDFDFLLSLFIGRDDDDINSIAIHAVMDAAGFSKHYHETPMDIHEGRLPHFAQSMMRSDRVLLSRPIMLRLLQNERGERFFTNASVAAKSGFLKDPFMQALVKEMFRLDTFNKRKSEIGINAFGQMYTMDRLARIICKIGEIPASDFMEMVLKEENKSIAVKMAYFLDRLAWIFFVEKGAPEDSRYHKELSDWFCQEWVDVIIHLAKNHKIALKQTHYVRGMIEDALDYRREDVKDALIALLNNTKRKDIWLILDILDMYHFDETQEVVIEKHLKKDSPHLKSALKYLYRQKDPKSFEDVWSFLEGLESSVKKIDNDVLTGIGRYFVGLLNLKEGEGLSGGQKQKIRGFTDRHILNQDLRKLLDKLSDEQFGGDISTKILPDESSDYTDKISLVRVWLSLAGFFNRDDRFDEIMQAAEKSLKFINILDVSIEALLSLNSDESYEYLKEFAISILLDEKDDVESVKNPEEGGLIYPKETVYKILQRHMSAADPGRRRELFVDMIDISILNESREVFDKLLHAFISTDPTGALDTLRSGKWIDVDISNIDPDPLDSEDITGIGDKVYNFKGLRDFFLARYYAYIKKPEVADGLRLIDDDESFWERVRFGIRIILLIDLGLIGDEEKRQEAKMEFLIDSAFKRSGFSAIMHTEERLSALVALKPVVEISNMEIEMPKLKMNYKKILWKRLLAHDPIFYKPLEKEMDAYLSWLIKKGIVSRDYKTALDRFGAYFLKSKQSRYKDDKLCDYEDAENRIEKFEEFLRNNVLQFFYPEEEKCKNPYTFTKQLIYTLVSIFSKRDQERKDRSVDAEPVLWPMFLLPSSDAIVVKVRREGYVEPIPSIIEEVSSYVGGYVGLLPAGKSEEVLEGIDSAA